MLGMHSQNIKYENRCIFWHQGKKMTSGQSCKHPGCNRTHNPLFADQTGSCKHHTSHVKGRKWLGKWKIDEPRDLWNVPRSLRLLKVTTLLSTPRATILVWENQKYRSIVVVVLNGLIVTSEHAHARWWCSPRSPHTGISPGRPAPCGRSTTLSQSPCKTTSVNDKVRQTRWDEHLSKCCSDVETVLS